MKHRTTQYSDRNRSHNTEGHIIRTSGEDDGAYMMLIGLVLGKDKATPKYFRAKVNAACGGTWHQ